MNTTEPLILAIDTSCDDTSAAVVQGSVILSNIIASQTQLHKQYGGVFPTVAKQAHKENIQPTVDAALKRAGVTLTEVTAIAVTAGPGLAPALEVGLSFAKQLAAKTNKPLLAINHIEGHVLSVLAQAKSRTEQNLTLKEITQSVNYPVLALVISGGHSEFIKISQIGSYKIIGQTLDDAAGECLDKIGRMLNLGYPAGPTIDKFAKLGNPQAYEFPLPLTQVKDFNLSFSGLKTFARNLITDLTTEKSLTKQQIYDLCASAQYGIFRHIAYKLTKILETEQFGEIWLGGGVAANIELRTVIRQTIRDFQKKQRKKGLPASRISFRTPYTKRLCQDNAAMIGTVASFAWERGTKPIDLPRLDRKPRWRIEHI